MKTRIFTCLITLFLATNAIAVKIPKTDEIKLLIVDGLSNHDWQRTTQAIIHILNEYKGFKIDVSTSPADKDKVATWKPDFMAYDVVLLNFNDHDNPVNWSTGTQHNLEEFVSGGRGLYIFHSANNGFMNWVEYNKMIGLGWRNKSFGKAAEILEDGKLKIIEAGEGENTGHGARVNALVTRNGNHPIQKGLPGSWIFADIEVYTYARGPMENVTILSYAKDALYKKNFPVEWVIKYGKGRVYNSTLGHFWKDQQNPEGMRCAAFQTEMVRALQWLAKRKVDTSLPIDFPGTEYVSLRDNLGMEQNSSVQKSDFIRLFNDKDLTGWGYRKKTGDIIVFESFDGMTETPENRFFAKGGILTVNPYIEGYVERYGAIWTKKEFPKDFILTLEFRASKNADSGIFLRGTQLQCRDYLLAGPYKNLKNYKPQDWNKVEVVVKNNVARCTCNDEILEEALSIPDTGPIGLESDRGQMEYRNIQIRELE